MMQQIYKSRLDSHLQGNKSISRTALSRVKISLKLDPHQEQARLLGRKSCLAGDIVETIL